MADRLEHRLEGRIRHMLPLGVREGTIKKNAAVAYVRGDRRQAHLVSAALELGLLYLIGRNA